MCTSLRKGRSPGEGLILCSSVYRLWPSPVLPGALCAENSHSKSTVKKSIIHFSLVLTVCFILFQLSDFEAPDVIVSRRPVMRTEKRDGFLCFADYRSLICLFSLMFFCFSLKCICLSKSKNNQAQKPHPVNYRLEHSE